ncbi:MAG: aspartate--ammonia ligase [Clostridia bacterium]|nr:aspartate--ammonia ligase [Clostridia bacterium]
MSKTFIPKGYKSALDLYQTQSAICVIHDVFEKKLGDALNLIRVSAPLFVEPKTGLNDDLNGVERAVTFDIKETGTTAAVVHSLAKWKRMALYTYGFPVGEGIYTDMNAIRRDEDMDNLHSIYVDQWDWEKVITKEQRTVEYLKDTVNKIVSAICDTEDELNKKFPLFRTHERSVSFVTSQELEDMYPDKTPKERENEYLKEHKTSFIMQIGKKLRSGKIHDGRAPDYDDWELNGDIMFWNDILGCAFEVSSMGIRVSPESLDRQLKEAGADARREMTFHKMLLEGKLPYTIGGGIGQSRLSMLLLEKAHIGEVQSSVWDEETKKTCREAGVILL